MPTAADYTWFDGDDNELVNGFSIFWVKGLTPQQVITRIGGTVIDNVSWSGLVDQFYEGERSRWLAGVVDLGGWSFVLDLTGFASIEEDTVTRLSKGTTAISQFLNVELDDNFRLVEDGDVKLDFAPWEPTHRQGMAPDSLLPVMEQIGFDLSQHDLDLSDPNYKKPYTTEAALALAEYLTGIRLTLGLLRSQDYLLAEVPAP
ncbi:DUF6461 domain-containing protein [Actinoplanes sp. NPDC051633]|uniref:DUF6461 domain-containing protein n=1 Tax=Actinoplanes sp. NPDC051633 TaxID=3155670 RepID=UPI00344A62CB